MINMAKETHSKSLMIKTLTWTTFQQVKIDQTVMMFKKRRMKMKASTIQMMTMTTWMRIWSSLRSLKRKCNSNKCSTCQISLLVRREVIQTLDQIKCITKSNMMTLTQNFVKQLSNLVSTKKVFERFSSKCMSNKPLKKQVWKAT